MSQAALSLLGILNNVLDFSKIEAGKLARERAEFRLEAVPDRLVSLIGLLAPQKGIELLVRVAPGVPTTLVGDLLRLEQVLVNLCSHAVKFTQRGEIVVTCARAHDAGTLRFSVRDTGPGMTVEQVTQLFTPFHQLDASDSRRHGGTGLRLAISRQLVALMGGESGVPSEPGAGSEFFLTVRVDVPAAVAPELAVRVPDLIHRAVLIVDDSAAARDTLASELTAFGATVERAATAAQGLARVQASPSRFDIVLVDMTLPDGDALEPVDSMRRIGTPGCRYLLVTSIGDELGARRAHERGLHGCLFKPVSRHPLALGPDAALRGAAAKAATVERSHQATVPAGLRGRVVLLVEDNEFNRLVACGLLGDVAGIAVETARDGPEALRLLVVQMPGMDGFEVTRRIRQQPQLVGLPVIAMTAHAMGEDRERSVDGGMDDFVAKPVEPAELFAVLARWIGEGAATGGESGPRGCRRRRRRLFRRGPASLPGPQQP